MDMSGLVEGYSETQGKKGGGLMALATKGNQQITNINPVSQIL